MTAKKHTSRRGASKLNEATTPSHPDKPIFRPWALLLVGLLFGGAYMLSAETKQGAAHTNNVKSTQSTITETEDDNTEALSLSTEKSSTDIATATTSKTDNEVTDNTEASLPVYDFYTVLPESEEQLASTERTENPVKVIRTQEVSVEAYLLQAGSFRSRADADRMRANLLMSGLDPTIIEVKIANDELWYRVQVGPYHTEAALKQAEAQLAEHNIEALKLAVKS